MDYDTTSFKTEFFEIDLTKIDSNKKEESFDDWYWNLIEARCKELDKKLN